MKKIKDVKADRQSPDSVVTPAKKQEPTAAIWKQGGFKSPQEAIDKDKSDVRKPVGPGSTENAGS